METIYVEDSATQLANKVNANFGKTVISAGDSAADAVSAQNAAFAGTAGAMVLSASDTATDFVAALNENFSLYDNTDVDGAITMLHVSDTHGYTTMFDEAISEMGKENSDVGLLIVTGDLTQYRTSIYTDDTITALTTLKNMGDKLLMCPGNHDTYENHHYNYGGAMNQVCETAWLKEWMGNRVNWGDPGNVGGYWYKDIAQGRKTLRIISLDQYEIGSYTYNDYIFATVYSQKQINWLINLLANTPSNYYIVIMMHEPAVQSPAGSGTDMAATGMAASNLFTSELLATFGNTRKETYLNLLPRIIRAYMYKESISFTYGNYNNKGGHGLLTVSADFTNVTPATFLFYIGGHQHEDICGYIPYTEWADQLMLFVTAGDSKVWNSTQDDLLWNFSIGSWPYTADQYAEGEDSFRINKLTIDFDRETVTVERIGNKTTALFDNTNGAARPHGGRVRDQITFPFKKGGLS